MKYINNFSTVLLLCLAPGLLPFFPEPHVWGKLLWVLGGANGMQAMDYFDLIFHGFPWILLIRLVVLKALGKLK